MAKGKYAEWQTPEGILKLEGWARDGLTDDQIAHNMGINRATLYRWKREHCDICNALKAGKEVVDRQVENALLRRALGTTTTSTTYKMVKVDATVLKARRQRRLNELKSEHPDWGKSQLVLEAAESVATYERIPMIVTENELAPSEAAAIFWLKNRKPEQYREKSFIDLNRAQVSKAEQDARKSKAEADMAEYKVKLLTGDTDGIDKTVIIDDLEGGQDERNKD